MPPTRPRLPAPATCSAPADARIAALQLALDNGFDDAAADEAVRVYIPAIHGRYAGLPGFIEVQIEAQRPSIFGGIIGRAAWPVGAFAVATNDQNLTFPFSMLALDPTECKAIAVSGGGVVEAHANIQANSNGSECTGAPIGFSRTGGATINVDAPDATCRVVGQFQDQGSGPPITCTVAQNSFALPDPLRNLAATGQARPRRTDALRGDRDSARDPEELPRRITGTERGVPVECKIPATGGPSNVPWILYPGLYPGGLEVTQGRTVYLMPGHLLARWWWPRYRR